MRMYLGHICTVVLLPSCHPHCLSCLAFMYCRTKYFSPVIFFSPRKGDVAYCFMFYMWLFLFPRHYSDTEYPRHARVALYRLSFGSASLWLHLLFKKNLLCFVSESFTHKRVPSLILHFMHLLTLIYEFIYQPLPPVTVMCTGPVCPVLNQTCLLVKKHKRNMKKAKLNYSYFWKVIYR